MEIVMIRLGGTKTDFDMAAVAERFVLGCAATAERRAASDEADVSDSILDLERAGEHERSVGLENDFQYADFGDFSVQFFSVRKNLSGIFKIEDRMETVAKGLVIRRTAVAQGDSGVF